MLNKIAKATYIRFEDLEQDKEYEIERFEIFVDTLYNKGNCIRVWLADMGYLILPSRFNYLVQKDDENLTALNKERLSLIYKGKAKGNSINLEFKERET